MTIVYFIFILLCLLYSLQYDGNGETDITKRQHRFVMLAVLLTMITGFSYRLGGDKVTYIQLFKLLNTHISIGDYIYTQFRDNSFMPIWSIVNYYSKAWFDSFYIVQLIEAAVVNGAVCYIVNRYCDRRFLVLLLYAVSGIYFQFNTEVMREGFAIGLGLFAIDQYMKGNRKNYFLLVFLALMAHLSASILLLFPLSKIVRANVKSILLLSLSAMVLWCISTMIVRYGIDLLQDISPALKDKMLMYGKKGTTLFGLIQLMLRYLLIPYVFGTSCLYFEGDTDRAKKWQQLFSFQLLVGMIICVLGFEFMRFQNYYRTYYLIFIAEGIWTMFYHREFFIRKAVCAVLLVFFNMLIWFNYYPNTDSHYYDLFFPYTSIVNENKDAKERIAIYYEANKKEPVKKGKRDLN